GQEGDAPRLAAAGDVLGVQRRPRQPAEPGIVAAMATPVAGGFPRTRHGADRRLGRLGMARLPQLLCRDRRRADAIGIRRLALGRRGFHPRPRPGADWPVGVAWRRMEWAPYPVAELDRARAGALSVQSAIWLSLVAQH